MKRFSKMMTNVRGDTVNLCYMDGAFRPLNETTLPVSDLIIQRGVGVFESIPTVNGRPLCMTAHIERLIVSAKASTIEFPVAPDAMKSIIREGLALLARLAGAEPGRETLIRPYITGGDDFDELKGVRRPRFFILFENANRPPKELYEKGVLLWPLDMARRSPETKSVDYMTSYSLEARENGAFEVLYCPGGEITEGAHSSFFLVRDGELVTAPLTRVLSGTTRRIVIDLARRNGILVRESVPLLDELTGYAEAFITGSLKGILPVVRVGGTVIGDGRPGAVTKRLREIYASGISEWLE